MDWGQIGGTFSSTKWLEAACFGEHFAWPFLAVAMTRVWESHRQAIPVFGSDISVQVYRQTVQKS